MATWLQPARSQTTPASALSPVVVTATRMPTRVDQTIADVTVLDREAIERVRGRTLVELLARQPGIQYGSNGGLGKTSSLNLRGLEARHTLLLIDGVRYGSATAGAPSFENLPLDQIERIEIVRGPLSGLYGSDAVGGVVQVFTRRGATGWVPNGGVTLGSNRYGEMSAGVRFGDGAFDGSVQAQHLETRGFSATNDKVSPATLFNPDDDGFRQQSLTAQLGWKLSPTWRADARLLRSDGTSHFDSSTAPDIRMRLSSQVNSLEVGGPVAKPWRTLLRLSRSVDRATPSVLNDSSNLFETEQHQLSWENTLATPMGSLLLLAEQLKQDVRKTGAPYPVTTRTVSALAVGLSGTAGRHTWQGNLRQDANSQFGDQLNGSLGYGYDITPAWRAAASMGTSFVAPSFNQLYFPNFSNPDLLPEEGRHRELSLQWKGQARSVRAALFDNRIRGYITSGPSPNNVPRSSINGASIAYEAQLDRWTLSAFADHVDPRNDTADTANFGKLLPRRSRNSVKAAADVDLGAWRLGSSWSAYSERYNEASNATRVGGYGLLDLRADWRLDPRWTLGLRLNNVADKRYETVYGYNQPGREAFVSLRYSGL